jgi:hypothetical protein
MAVSPNINPCHPWVLVRETAIPLEDDPPEVNRFLSGLMLRSVMKFIPDDVKGEIDSNRLICCRGEALRGLISAMENEHFVTDQAHAGNRIYYSRSIFLELNGNEKRIAGAVIVGVQESLADFLCHLKAT